MVARLLAPDPTPAADAETVVLGLLGVLLGDGRKDRGLMSLVIDGRQHVSTCGRGQWISPTSPRPDGDPCSARCLGAQAAISAAAAWLRAREAAG